MFETDSPKRALITGISGQDGSLLANLLLEKGYEVYGTARDAQVGTFHNLKRLGIFDRVILLSMVPTDFRSVLQTLIKVKPNELYNLSGQSSVALSFQQPVETLDSIAIGTLNLLEAIRFIEHPVKFYNAGSSECFGNTDGVAANELTPFRPRSPYAVAKATAFWEVANYRESYGLFACSGILFNHESPLRPERFVTQKIITTACRIAKGSNETLKLGNIDIRRDWGWAEEYVEAMWHMLQRNTAEDFVIATGEAHSLREFVATVFGYLELNWLDHVELDESLIRPSEIMIGLGDPAKALVDMGWRANAKMHDVARMMVDAVINQSIWRLR